MTPGDPEEQRPVPLGERTCAYIYHALVTSDAVGDVHPNRIIAALLSRGLLP